MIYNGKLKIYSAQREQDESFFTLLRKAQLKALFEGKNMILNTGRIVGVHYLGDAVPAANKYLSYVKAGTGGHALGDTTTPIPPLATDTDLEDDEPETVTLLAKSYTPPGIGTALQMIFLMDVGQGNGEGSKIYTEAMLFCADGTSFAKETFPGALKDDTKKLYFEWTIIG